MYDVENYHPTSFYIKFKKTFYAKGNKKTTKQVMCLEIIYFNELYCVRCHDIFLQKRIIIKSLQ